MSNSNLKAAPQNEFCFNPNCRDHGKSGAGNIVKYGHYKNSRQRFKCKTYGGVFVETKNTVFYNRKLSEDSRLVSVNSALTIKTERGEKSIERTPCMAEGITDHIWTWKELLMFKIAPTSN